MLGFCSLINLSFVFLYLYVRKRKENLNEIKKLYPACDYIGNDRYVFNIGGNNYRLIAMIHFSKRTLYIRAILNHSEYNDLSSRGILEKI